MAEETKKDVKASQMETEMQKAEMELKQLEIKAKKAELQDLEERLAEREMKRENKRQRSLTNGATLKTIKSNDALNQTRCNHKKGGNGAEGFVQGQGDDPQYAVMKHKFANGDIWVRCLRCGKTWKPPIRKDFADQAEYNAAFAIYKEALGFMTRNVMSAGVMFTFSDGGEFYRQQTKDVDLR